MATNANTQKGQDWANKVYAKKLSVPASLPSIGDGYTPEMRAAYAVKSICQRKLFAGGSKAGCCERKMHNLPRYQRDFWMGAMKQASQLYIDAENALMSGAQ